MQYKWYEVISDKWKWILSLLRNPEAHNRCRYRASLSLLCLFFWTGFSGFSSRYVPGQTTSQSHWSYKSGGGCIQGMNCHTFCFFLNVLLKLLINCTQKMSPSLYHHLVSAFLWDLQIKLFMCDHKECSVFSCLTQSQWKNTSRRAEVEMGILGWLSSRKMPGYKCWAYNNLLFVLPEWIESTDCAEQRPTLWLPWIAAVTLHHISLSHQLFLEPLFLTCI